MNHNTISKVMAVIFIIIVGIIALMALNTKKDKTGQQVNTLNMQNEQVQEQYNRRQQNIMDQMKTKSIISKNPTLRSYGINKVQTQTIKYPINQFMWMMYDWNTESLFNSRKWRMRAVATPKALNIEPIMKSDKDTSGQSEINNLSENSALVSNSMAVTGQKRANVFTLCKARYKTWTGANEDQAQTGQQWYLISVNIQTHKIDKIQLIYTNQTEQDN